MTDYKAPTTFKIGTTQTVAVGSSSAATSNAFNGQTREIRIVTTVDAYVEMNATSPTATSSSIIVPAFTPEYFRVAIFLGNFSNYFATVFRCYDLG